MMRGYAYGYGPGMMGGYSPWFGLLGLMFWFFILVAVVIMLVWVVRRAGHHGYAGPHQHTMGMMQQHPMAAPPSGPVAGPTPESPMDIARRRLAAGEISIEQFDEIRKALGG